MTGLIVALAMLVGQVSPSTPVADVLSPTDKWDVHYSESDCAASRTFGATNDSVRLVLTTLPIADSRGLSLVTKKNLAKDADGVGSIVLSPSSIRTELPFNAGSGTEPDTYFLHFGVPASLIDALKDATAITVAIDNHATTLHLSATRAALTALETCDENLLRRWGFNPKERDDAVKPAQPIGGVLSQIKPLDYPIEARKKQAQGRAIVMLTIDARGRSKDCRAIVSTGDASLDQASCDAELPIKYTPALDKSGKPVTSHVKQVLLWRLP